MKKLYWIVVFLLGLLLLIFFIFKMVQTDSSESLVVKISDGKIEGKSNIESNGDKIYYFLNIPYAKPPVGNLRFKAPQPVEAWDGVKDAKKFGNECAFFYAKSKGAEDCLNLNVYTKSLPNKETKPKPVIFFIHGGQFLRGSNHVKNTGGPEYLIAEDIVLVTINYRLGLLGFLSLDDTSLDVPGNAGLKDQVMALKWVQRNIKYFNGDPNRVTIAGRSAGAVSVEFLQLSHTAKNLFSGAISQSGAVENSWSIGNFDVVGFGKFLGKNIVSEKDALKVLTDMSADELCKAQDNFLTDVTISVIGPVVEEPNESAFITKYPMDIIQSGEFNSVPVLQGYNSNEGIYFDILMNKLNVSEKKKYRRNKIIGKILDDNNIDNDDLLLPLEKMLPFETDFNNKTQLELISEKIFNYYFKQGKKDKILFATDSMFVVGVITSAINKAKLSKNPVYLYRFSLVTKLNQLRRSGSTKNYKDASFTDDLLGACHGDDGPYTFSFPHPKGFMGDREKRGIRRMVKLWTNFVKYGDPTPNGNDLNVEWKPIQNETVNFLDIGDELVVKTNPEKERMEVWREIFHVNPITSKYL